MPFVSWACTAAVACLSSDAEERDLCNMTSDILRFLRMGFFAKLLNESVLESEILDGSV